MKFLSVFMTMFSLFFNVALPEAAETVKVAAIFAKTGKAALDNANALNGIRFAVEELNQQGGVLGKQVELIELDNKSTAIGSKLAAQKAVKDDVVTVFGANWSSHSLAMAPVLQASETPMISPCSTNPQVTLVGDYIFRICYTDPFQGRVMAGFAFDNLKARTAGVLINANSKFSEGLAQFFVQNYKKKGGKILFEENYLEQTADFSFLVNKIKLLRPEVIFLPGHVKDSGFIIKQVRDSGIATTFIGGDGWNDTMYKIVGNAIEGNFYSDHWHQDASNKKSLQFVEKQRNRHGKFGIANALSYDCVFLFADAVHRSGSLNPVEIRKAIAATEDFQGVTGIISFDDNGDPIKSAVILKFDKGASVYVKTVKP